MTLVDVVVVSFNSREHLRSCVEPLAGLPDVRVVVVDNASTDGSLESIAGLDVLAVRSAENEGFAAGCNRGWRAGSAPFVLFLNPDATIADASLRRLAAALERDPRVGAVAPRIERPDGTLAWSQRRAPRIRSAYARALFLHRVFPRAGWADDVVRDASAYVAPGSPDWVSGACVLVRRVALEAVHGWDEGFFLYGEDADLCARLRAAGWEIRFEPTAKAVHAEGASAPRSSTLPHLAASRLRYLAKHRGSGAAAAGRVAVALGALTHLVGARGGRATRAGHARALRLALTHRVGRLPAADDGD